MCKLKHTRFAVIHAQQNGISSLSGVAIGVRHGDAAEHPSCWVSTARRTVTDNAEIGKKAKAKALNFSVQSEVQVSLHRSARPESPFVVFILQVSYDR